MTVNLTDFNIKFFDKLQSTNDYAKQKASEVDDILIISSYFQEKGKGQAGNKWESEADKNILMTYAVKHKDFPAAEQFVISQIISLAIVDLIKPYVDNPELLKIKWPNDIYYSDKKIAGILIENTLEGSLLKHSFCGIGININQEKFSEDIPNPVSLKLIVNENFDLRKLLLKLILNIESGFSKIKLKEEIDSQYHDLLLFLNERRRYIYKGKNIEAKIIGTDKFGRLLLKYGSCEFVCNHGQVKYVF